MKTRQLNEKARKSLPDCILHRVAPDGRTVYRVHIRRDGVPPFSRQFETLAEAMRARDAHLGIVQKLQAGGLNTAVTLAQAIESYKDGFRFKALARTDERTRVLKYWLARFGDVRLATLTTPQIAAERDRLLRKYPNGATVCVYLSGFSQAWAWAQEILGAVPNLVTMIRWPRIKRPPPRKFSQAQIRHLLQRADGYSRWPPLGLLVRLSLITTQRRGTVTSPRWSEVDLEEGTVEVRRIKNGAAISLPIEGETLDLLREHFNREKEAGRGHPHSYVFESPTLNKPMIVKKHVDWLFDDESLNGLTFKHLRSTTLSRLFTHAKLDLPRVMAISGHKTARVLLEHYAHADDEEKRRAIREHSSMLLGN